MHAKRVGECVVATDGNEHVDPLGLENTQRMVGEVERPVAVGPVGQEVGNLLGTDVGGVGS